MPLDRSRPVPELLELEPLTPGLPCPGRRWPELLEPDAPIPESLRSELLPDAPNFELLRSELLPDAFSSELPRPVPPAFVLSTSAGPVLRTRELAWCELPPLESPSVELPWRVPALPPPPLALIPPWLPRLPERLLPIEELPTDEPLLGELAFRPLRSFESDGLRVAELPIPSSFRFTRSVRPLRLSLPPAIFPPDESFRPAPKSLRDDSDELDPDAPREPLRSDELESMFWSLLRSAI